MKSVKAVIFDLGRVLVDVNIGRLMKFFCAQIGPENAAQTLPQIMTHPLMAQYSSGKIDSRTFHRVLCDSYGLKLSFEKFAAQWCDIFSPIDGMEDIVESLSKKVKLGLLSDTDPLHWEYIQSHYPMMRHFPRPTLSFEIGMIKPQREIYLAAADNIKTAAAECLFIDDLEDNVRGAKAAGLQAIRFQGVRKLCEVLKKMGLLECA